MNFSRHPNRILGLRSALCRRDQQALRQGSQIESAVEAIGESAQVLLCVFSKPKAVVTAAQAGLEISQHRVDPLQLWHCIGLAPGHDGALMGATCLRDRAETGQAIGVDDAAGGQVLTGPLRDGFELEARHRVELDAQRVARITDRDCSNKSNFVFRTPPGLAASAFAPQIRIVNLDFATERVAGLPRGHGLHQLVVHQPGCGIAHAQLAFERERRHAGFGLTDEVDRQKPGRQRQFRRLKNGACDQRGLMPTGLTLKDIMAPRLQDAVGRTAAVRTTETIGPARFLQRRRAKHLGAKKLEKLRHRQTGLKLDAIHGHDAVLKNER